jgi:acyl-coenzyme A thioesterase PaaI-like protein
MMSVREWSGNRCFVCGRDNPIGLHAAWDVGSEAVTGAVTLPETMQGFNGVAHGGVIAAVLDDAMWHAVYARTSLRLYTVELTTRYRRPVPLGTPIFVEAVCVEIRHRGARAEARIRDGEGGAVLAEAEARFLASRHAP